MLATLKRPAVWIPLALIGSAAIVATMFWLDRTCLVGGRRLAMKQTGSVGCFEFWLYRYQSAWASMIGVAAALTAAWVAWRAAGRQIEALAEQNRIILGEIPPVFDAERQPTRIVITATNRSPRKIQLTAVRLIKPMVKASISSTANGYQIELKPDGKGAHFLRGAIAELNGPDAGDRGALPSAEIHLFVGGSGELQELEIEFTHEFAKGLPSVTKLTKRFD